jgi:hypothetical protein
MGPGGGAGAPMPLRFGGTYLRGSESICSPQPLILKQTKERWTEKGALNEQVMHS